MTREALKAQWMSKAEAIIDEMLNEGELPQDISRMEQAAVKGGQAMRAALMEGLNRAVLPLEGTVKCPKCGAAGRRKGKQTKWVLTLAGEVQVEREYCYCKRCKAGFFPQ
jgi:hypothetical protein